jgi:hypothetical protein
VSLGGDNDILNLLTSCADCNGGKGARELADDSMLQRQRAQLDELNERREQLEMMIQWRDGLRDLDRETIDMLAARIEVYLPTGHKVNETGRRTISKWIKDFGFNVILQAIDEAWDKAKGQNLAFADDAALNTYSQMFLDNIGRFASVIKRSNGDDSARRLFYVRGILNKRCDWMPAPYKAMADLKAFVAAGVDAEDLVNLAKCSFSYSRFCDEAESLIARSERGR